MSVQCVGAPGLCRAIESVSVKFVFVVIVLFPFFFFFLSYFHVCTSDVPEVPGASFTRRFALLAQTLK